MGGGGCQGQGCMALDVSSVLTRVLCCAVCACVIIQGTDGEACAWCGKSSFLGSPCVSESTAKYIPSFLSKCKMGKKKKGDDAELAVA